MDLALCSIHMKIAAFVPEGNQSAMPVGLTQNCIMPPGTPDIISTCKPLSNNVLFKQTFSSEINHGNSQWSTHNGNHCFNRRTIHGMRYMRYMKTFEIRRTV